MATLRPLDTQYGLTVGGSLVIDRERNLAVENASIKNLTVTGTVTAVNSTETYIKDSNIVLNSGIEAGAITTLGTITGGSNYTPGTYKNVLLTIVSGTAGIGATADITVNASGAVSAVTMVNPGYGYATNTVFSATAADLDSDTSPNGTGFQVTVTAVGAGSASTDAFITVSRGTTGSDVALKWDETNDKWQITNDGSTFGNIVSTADTGTVTNAMLAGGIALTKLSSDTTTALGVGTIELGNANDTTLSRSAAGVLAVEGVVVPTISSTNTLTNKTLTAPRITSASSIDDANGNQLIQFPSAVTSAVNELTISNAATGAAPSISATGGDTNITLNLRGKGTGTINVGSTGLSISGSTSGTVTLVTPATAGSTTITLPATSGTVYVSGGTDIPLADGGTNASLTASAGSVVYSTASAMAFTAVGSSGQVLTSNGTNAPSFQTLTLENLPDAWVKRAVKAATTADLGTVTYANGTAGVGATITGPTGASAVVFPAQDGVTISVGDRILVKDQTTTLQNGIYTLTTVGVAGTTAWVLTRAADADTASEIAGAVVQVDQGTVNGGYVFDCDFKSTDTLGTTGITFNRLVDTSSKLNIFASTTSAELAGVISDETGSGALVFATSPTLVTPTLGVATATSINKVTITAPATSATLTIANGKTLTVSNTLTFTGTDASSVAFGAGGTVAYTANKLSVFAATTSAELAGVISDETGSGALVFATSPAFTTSVTTGSASFDVFNTSATTVNAFGAATTLAIANTGTGARTINIATAASGGASTLTFGGAVSGNTIEINSTAAGSISLNTDVTTGTANIFTSVTGTVNIGAVGSLIYTGTQAAIEASTTTVATITQTATDTFVASTFRSAEYLVQIVQGTAYQISKILLVHDGTTAYITEYGTVTSGSVLGTLDADISGGTVRLLVTMGSATSATVKVSRTSIVV